MDVRRPRHRIRLLHLLSGVRTADDAQGLVIHRLRIDADALYARAPDGFELRQRQRVGTTRFHRVLHCAGEALHHLLQQTRQLLLIQRCRRAAPDVNRAQFLPRVAQELRTGIHLPEQRCQVGRNQMPVAQFAAGKGAVGAARCAERNADVHIHPVVARRRKLLLHRYEFRQQCRLLRRNIKLVHQMLLRVRHRHAFVQRLVHQVRRTNARHAPPRRMNACFLAQQVVERLTAEAAERPAAVQRLNPRIRIRRNVCHALRRLRFPIEADDILPALDSRREMIFRRIPHAVRQREQARHVHQIRLDGRQVVLQLPLNFVAHFSLHVRGKFPDCAPSAPPAPATLASARCSPWANRFARSRSGRACRP